MSIISDWTPDKGAAFGRKTLAFDHGLVAPTRSRGLWWGLTEWEP